MINNSCTMVICDEIEIRFASEDAISAAHVMGAQVKLCRVRLLHNINDTKVVTVASQ